MLDHTEEYTLELQTAKGHYLLRIRPRPEVSSSKVEVTTNINEDDLNQELEILIA